MTTDSCIWFKISKRQALDRCMMYIKGYIFTILYKDQASYEVHLHIENSLRICLNVLQKVRVMFCTKISITLIFNTLVHSNTTI